MERLTKWNGQKYVLPQGRTSDGRSYWRIIADRLAAYENTGLAPEDVEQVKKSFLVDVKEWVNKEYEGGAEGE